MSDPTGERAREAGNWSAEQADRAAELLWGAWRRGDLIDELPAGCRPGSYQEGHDIQARLAERIGSRLGWKIAATSAAGQRHIAVDRPLGGRLFDRYLLEDGDRISVSDGHMHMLVAEAEFAFRVAEGTGSDLAGELYLAIELPDSRFASFETSGGPQLVADNACGSRFVLGPSVPGWREMDLLDQPVAVRVNGRQAASGRGRNVLNGPLDALAWLAADLAGRGQALSTGEIVTTGVAALPVPVGPGDRVVAEFQSMGSVSIRFDP